MADRQLTAEGWPKEVEGWRVFGVSGDGLIPPYMTTMAWAVTDADIWRRGPNFGRCVDGGDHLAPGDDCTCGFRAVESLDQLLAYATTPRQAPGLHLSLLITAGVVARTKIWGKIRPGHAIGEDDPPTTWRGSQARILELHLAPEHTAALEALEARYAVPVIAYTAESWPQTIAPLPVVDNSAVLAEAFVAEVRTHGFGLLNLSETEVILKLGTRIIEFLRKGVTIYDAATCMFESSARPTMNQVWAMVAAAIRHLGPDCEMSVSEPLWRVPPTEVERLARQFQHWHA